MPSKILAFILTLFLIVPSWGVMDLDISSNDYVSFPNTTLDGEDTLTFTYWLKTVGSGQQTVWSGANSSNDNEILIFHLSEDSLRFYTGQNQSDYVEFSIASVATGKWIHFTWIRDSVNDEVSLYINGVADNENPQSATLNPIDIDSGGLLIGQEQDSVGGEFHHTQDLEGQIDDVRVYDRVLSEIEIENLAQSRSRLLITDGLIGWWKFDDGTDGATAGGSNTARDSSGQGNHGTPTNGPVWRASDWIMYP